jgi:hypothetical protein
MSSSGVSKIRHTTRVSFRTSLGGVQAGGYRCTPALDSHRGELMILVYSMNC